MSDGGSTVDRARPGSGGTERGGTERGQSGEPIVLLRQVSKSYGRQVVTEVLHGIDFRLEAGEFTALVGPSGSGKSTLLNLIGLLDRPTAGTIAIRGEETPELNEDRLTALRGREIGFIFQFHHLLPAFTALENVMLPAWACQGRADAAMRGNAAELLRRVGLHERMAYKPGELSGGQQQRVAIARSLSMGASLVLADEPTGNLDTQSADQVFDLLREINRRDGTTFLIVTHDPRMATRCDRIVELVDGRITADRASKAD